MVYDKFEIKKTNDNTYLIIFDGLSQKLFFDDCVIKSIFWYPLFESNVEDFIVKTKESFFEDFPIEILIRSVVFEGTYYWINKALDWYLYVEGFDNKINNRLLEILKLDNENLSQKFKQKIKNIITIKNRHKSDELYEKNRDSKLDFIKGLENNNIPYKELIDCDLIIVNSNKYIFPSSTLI